MPKFNITAEVTLRMFVEPDGYFNIFSDEAEDFEDESSWYGEDRGADGQIRFTIEAVDEDDARDKAYNITNYNLEFSDERWEIEDVAITDVEPVEAPMTKELAVEVLQAFLANSIVTFEVVRAIEYLLVLITRPVPVAVPPVGAPGINEDRS